MCMFEYKNLHMYMNMYMCMPVWAVCVCIYTCEAMHVCVRICDCVYKHGHCVYCFHVCLCTRETESMRHSVGWQRAGGAQLNLIQDI